MDLDESEHLRLIFESAKDYAIFTMDPGGAVTTWNAGAERIFGYCSEDILGRNASILWTAADQEHDGAAVEMETAAREGVAEDKRWHRRKDGSRFFASGMLRPMRDNSGSLLGFTKVCRDVTVELAAEQKLAEARAEIRAALDRERSRLAEVFQHSPAFMAVLRGPEHVFEMVNEQYLRMVGHREMVGLPVRVALPEVEGQGYLELLDRVYQTSEAFEGKGMPLLVQQAPDEVPVERFIDFVYQPTHDHGGQVSGIFVHGVDVTEREMAEVTAQRLASIVDSSDDAIIGSDLQGRITSWNGAAERILGYSAAEMIGEKIDRIIPEERRAEEGKILARIAEGKRVDHREVARVAKSGALLELSITVSAIRDSAGKVVGLSKVARDISERQRAEKKLRASEKRFRQLWATTTDAVVIIDVDQRVEYANPSLERILGYTEEELMVMGLATIVPERLRAAHDAGMRRYLATGVRKLNWSSTELPALHRDGREIPIEISFSHFKEDGRDLFAAFMRDITDRKQAQEALQRSEARFRQLADSMPTIVWATRPDGYLDYYSRRWYEFTGVPEGVGGDESWEPIIHPDDLERVHERWHESLRTGQPYELEFRYLRASDRQYRWFLGRALPVRDAEGNIVRWFGTSTDIHNRKMLQEENEQLLASERAARADAERSSRIKDEFLATLSHELRTPLNAILGWTQILRDGEMDTEELAQGMEVIERNARAQAKIIDDLLDMSRIISGKVRLDVQQVDLAPLVRAAVESIAPGAEAKGVRLISVLDPKATPVSGDPNRLQQIFWNLLSNAVKFTPRDGRVQVVLKRVDSHLEVSVIDSGEGMAAEFLPHVFDRFRQADATTTRRHGGLGLGLAIVKQLVELHGGTVGVESAGPGEGSHFKIALPLNPLQPEIPRELSTPTTRRANPAPSQRDFSARLRGVKVLVVDDESDAREMVKRLLKQSGAVVRSAGSANEAMMMIEEEIPEVLVSDIGMPEEDGYSLITRVRALDPVQGGKVPAIALTAYARSEDRMKAVMAGFNMHIAKPVELGELIAMVASLAGRTVGGSGGGDGNRTRE